jgi:hypothetical protein
VYDIDNSNGHIAWAGVNLRIANDILTPSRDSSLQGLVVVHGDMYALSHNQTTMVTSIAVIDPIITACTIVDGKKKKTLICPIISDSKYIKRNFAIPTGVKTLNAWILSSISTNNHPLLITTHFSTLSVTTLHDHYIADD